jgi:predicted transcriptional regulator
MANIRRSVALPESLLSQVDHLAHELNVPRSHVFVLALERFVSNEEDQRLFDQINEAYRDEPQSALEQSRLGQIRRQHRRMAESEW